MHLRVKYYTILNNNIHIFKKTTLNKNSTLGLSLREYETNCIVVKLDRHMIFRDSCIIMMSQVLLCLFRARTGWHKCEFTLKQYTECFSTCHLAIKTAVNDIMNEPSLSTPNSNYCYVWVKPYWFHNEAHILPTITKNGPMLGFLDFKYTVIIGYICNARDV